MIISGVWTPSIRPGGARWVGCTSGEEMLSILEVISSTRLFTNLGATYNFCVRDICYNGARKDELDGDLPQVHHGRGNTSIDQVYRNIVAR